ncbi:MAG: M23 family metallopeptidase [Anaerolineales bacterium]|nr:M23 family metallopeptidase [Anaerolineales bacterium]
MSANSDLTRFRLLRPVDCPLTQGFGENPQLYARFGQAGHNGLDFGCPLGTVVRAAAAGKASRARLDPDGYGRYLLLEHGGYSTLYAHLESWLVRLGESVQAGQAIARSGDSGFSTGPHLHFELRIAAMASRDTPGYAGREYPAGAVDPIPFFAAIAVGEAGPAEARAALQPVACRVSAADGLRVRLGPGGRPVGGLSHGDLVLVERLQGQWAGIVLWVHQDYLEPLDTPRESAGGIQSE